MVGRNSSMLLIAFCMTTSNTHSRGRHSSSISLVDDAGKYLENTHTEDKQMQTSKYRLEMQIHTSIYTTQFN